MPTPVHDTLPKWVQFNIGRTHVANVATALIGIVKRDSQPVPRTVVGLVENFGDAAFTIEVDESANNNLANNPFTGGGAADAYADRALRVDGAAVATGVITVQPGGKVVFVIEMTALSDRYLRFQTSTTSPDIGRLTLAHFDGTLELRSRETVP